MRTAWLGLGGNIGPVETALAAALRALDDTSGIEIRAVSDLWETPPWGVTDQPRFLNCCAAVGTSFAPGALLARCNTIEAESGRERKVRWGPRTIDIDIIAIEGVERSDPKLTLPHPRAAERAFVLVPLAEIAGDLMLDGKGVAERADTIDRQGMVALSRTADWWRSD